MGIFTPTTILVKSGDIIGGQTVTGIIDPVSVNDGGIVAFGAGTTSLANGLSGIFTQDKLVAEPGDVIEGNTLTRVLDSAPVVDNSGHVVFFSLFHIPPATDGQGLFTNTHAILKTGDNVAGRNVGGVGSFDLSREGLLAAETFAFPLGGIFSQSSVILSLKDLVDGHSVEGFGRPSINDSGTIVFAGLFDCYSSPSGCLRAIATQYHLIAKEGDIIGGFAIADFGATAINNKGAMAFRIRIGPNTTSFLLFSSELGVVAKPGDVIEGKTLASVGGAPGGPGGRITLNDTGELAFVGTFSDGSEAIILATPRFADTIAPTTVATPAPLPNGNGWNNANVVVALAATDNPGGSGVKQIQFGLSGAQNIGLQTVLGNTASVTISAGGTTVVTYFATDNAGNQETAKTLTVRIDKTPPVISGMPAPGCTIWPPNHKLVQVATVTASDALSGLAPGSFMVTGTSNDPANGQIVITGGPNQFNVQLGADKDQVYTLTATAIDLAGNMTTKQATCTVPHDQGK